MNQYIIHKYGLTNDIVVPDGFKDEPINLICSFNTERLIENMNSFFSPVEDESIFFFTKEMSDEYIAEAVEYCVGEVEKIRRGEPGIDMLEYAWSHAGAQK